MGIILNERWNYQLIEKNNNYSLSVLCGSVALYEVEIELNEYQICKYKEKGKLYVDELVAEIRNNPQKYIKQF